MANPTVKNLKHFDDVNKMFQEHILCLLEDGVIDGNQYKEMEDIEVMRDVKIVNDATNPFIILRTKIPQKGIVNEVLRNMQDVINERRGLVRIVKGVAHEIPDGVYQFKSKTY
jgi:hypothetical protein